MKVKQLVIDVRTDIDETINERDIEIIKTSINGILGRKVLGISVEADLTDTYKEQYPELINENYCINIDKHYRKTLIVPAYSLENAIEKVAKAYEEGKITISEGDILESYHTNDDVLRIAGVEIYQNDYDYDEEDLMQLRPSPPFQTVTFGNPRPFGVSNIQPKSKINGLSGEMNH